MQAEPLPEVDPMGCAFLGRSQRTGICFCLAQQGEVAAIRPGYVASHCATERHALCPLYLARNPRLDPTLKLRPLVGATPEPIPLRPRRTGPGVLSATTRRLLWAAGLAVFCAALLNIGRSVLPSPPAQHRAARSLPAVPRPGDAWHFPAPPRSTAHIILTIANPGVSRTAVRISYLSGARTQQRTVVIPGRNEAEIELPGQVRGTMTIRSSHPVLPQRLLMGRSSVQSSYGLPGLGSPLK